MIWVADYHGVVPGNLVRSTVVSIPKDRNINLTDYRGIALSSILGKLMYLVILARYGDRLFFSDLQQCAQIICIQRCLRRLLPIMLIIAALSFARYSMQLKLFSIVLNVKMFKLLLYHKFPPVCIRLFVNMY